MKRTEALCAIVLLAAVPGAALAGLYPGALRGVYAGTDMAATFTMVAAKNATPSPLPKPQVKPITVPTGGTQVTSTGIVRPAGQGGAVGGANHTLPGQIGGSSFTPKH